MLGVTLRAANPGEAPLKPPTAQKLLYGTDHNRTQGARARLEAFFVTTDVTVVFGPGTGEVKKAAIMDFLKNAIGVGELALGRDIVDESEFIAGLDQAAEGVLRALKATNLWQKSFGTGRAA